jgi:hypothetical protein
MHYMRDRRVMSGRLDLCLRSTPFAKSLTRQSANVTGYVQSLKDMVQLIESTEVVTS